MRWCQQEARHTHLLQLAEGTCEYAYLACLFTDFEEISRAASVSANAVNDRTREEIRSLADGPPFLYPEPV